MAKSQAMVTFDTQLAAMRPQFGMALPPHLDVDRFSRVLRSAVSAAPKLLECSRTSLLRAAMSAAVFGLECDGRQSAIVPFGGRDKTAQWIPMVNGLVTIAHNSGFIVQGDVVRRADDFDYARGLFPVLYHKPARGAPHDKDNPIIAAYAVAHPVKRGHNPVFEVMELEDILRVRDGSKGYQASKRFNKQSLWDTDFRGMARKTPVRALCNHLPWNVQKAVEVEDEYDNGREAWATKAEDGSITVDYADVTDMDDAPAEQRGATQQLTDQGDIVTEDEYTERLRAEGARTQAAAAQGKLDE